MKRQMINKKHRLLAQDSILENDLNIHRINLRKLIISYDHLLYELKLLSGNKIYCYKIYPVYSKIELLEIFSNQNPKGYCQRNEETTKVIIPFRSKICHHIICPMLKRNCFSGV